MWYGAECKRIKRSDHRNTVIEEEFWSDVKIPGEIMK